MRRRVPGPRWQKTASGVALSAILTGAACVIPTSPSSGALPILGACGLTPNYADSSIADDPPGRLLRWRQLPVRLHVDTVGAPPALAAVYRDAATRGAAIWDAATSDPGRTFEAVEAPSGAQIVIRFESGPGATASTTTEYSGRLLVRATTAIGRPARDADLVGRGLQAQVADLVVQVVGHEMGHALGILLHSPDPRDLMARVIRIGGAARSLTAADRHTLQQAYCR